VEANSVENGIGLVKLMGRNCGYIALMASIANRDVNLCLIPEAKFKLRGENSILQYIVHRLRSKSHCVIVVAEGAAEACLD